jgi:sortase (surface protein transpeptidase)
MMIQRLIAVFILLFVTAMLAACGNTDSSDRVAEASPSPATTSEVETTSTSTPEPTEEPTPTATPTLEPTEEPTPTATSTPEPTPEPTQEPTATPQPTPEPTEEPTQEPTATPQPTPEPTEEPTPTTEPILSENTAPPTPVMSQPEVQQPSQPVRIQIPAIGLDYQSVPVGLDEQGVPIVPKHDVGWYTLSAAPAQGENIVFWGHVLRWQDAPEIPAPFARVEELSPGAEIIIATANGNVFRYQVTEAVWVRPDEVQYILPTGDERVTLVSCIGDNVIVDGTLTKEFRLVTIARPVG